MVCMYVAVHAANPVFLSSYTSMTSFVSIYLLCNIGGETRVDHPIPGPGWGWLQWDLLA